MGFIRVCVMGNGWVLLRLSCVMRRARTFNIAGVCRWVELFLLGSRFCSSSSDLRWREIWKVGFATDTQFILLLCPLSYSSLCSFTPSIEAEGKKGIYDPPSFISLQSRIFTEKR